MRIINEELADKIIETYEKCFEKYPIWKIKSNYLRPSSLSKELLEKFEKISDFKLIFNELIEYSNSTEVKRSLLYRLLYLQKNPKYISKDGIKSLDELYDLARKNKLLPLYPNQIVEMGAMPNSEIQECVENAVKVTPHIKDRKGLRARDYLERFNDVLVGEIAEMMVIKWLKQNGKFAKSAVDKTSRKPDLGHDIILISKKGEEIKCSVKSSIAALRSKPEILLESTLGTKESEIRHVNIQVFFWYDLFLSGEHRVVLPNTANAAIFSWAGSTDIQKFKKYATEERECPADKLCELRSMSSLLEVLS